MVYSGDAGGALGKGGNCERAARSILQPAAPSCPFPWASPGQGRDPTSSSVSLSRLQGFRQSLQRTLQQLWAMCTSGLQAPQAAL